MLVGAYGYSYAWGAAYLLAGPVSGNIELASVGWRLLGPEDGSSSVGVSVSGAGDVDGDGLDDVIISTPGDGGVAALLFTEVAPDSEPTMGDASATYTSASGHYAAGWSSKSGGDINADGYVDLLIFDRGTTGAGVEVGVLAVVYGPALGTVDLSTLSPRITGTSATDGFAVEFANVGDMDGDGFADVAVGAPDPWPTGAGSVYLFPGPLAGSLDPDDAAIRFLGDGEDMAGWTLSAAGDTDGDGRNDLLVGAAGDDDGGMLAGAVWLVAGSVL